jgi:DNA mismatch endonuclease (patch repair protein)
MDVHNKATRSYNMSRIRSGDTGAELAVRKYLHSRGFRFRLHDRRLPGRPDIVLPKYRAVVEVRGCFWHGHEGCRYFVLPKTRTEFWTLKIQSNVERDRKNEKLMSELGWRVIVVWECELRDPDTLARLHDIIKN